MVRDIATDIMKLLWFEKFRKDSYRLQTIVDPMLLLVEKLSLYLSPKAFQQGYTINRKDFSDFSFLDVSVVNTGYS